jgi:hypothetical protein
MILLAVRLLNRAVDSRDLELVLYLIEFLGDLFFGAAKFTHSLFFYNQCRICSGLIGSPHKKIDSLVSMSRCAIKLMKPEMAIKLLLKGL